MAVQFVPQVAVEVPDKVDKVTALLLIVVFVAVPIWFVKLNAVLLVAPKPVQALPSQ
jgi:hypothetical protein